MHGETDIRDLTTALDNDELIDLARSLPISLAETLLSDMALETGEVPGTPREMARALEPDFVTRPHLTYLSERIAVALRDVEAGRSRRLVIQMPPRSGKTLLATMVTAAWVLALHPDWPIVLTSHDGALAVSWGRTIRRWVESGALGDRVSIAADSNAAGEWETTDGGIVLSRSVRESLTGRGAKVLIIDDPTKDFVEAHSKTTRDTVWNWWLSVAQTRLQGASLVIVTQTRWHENDLVGRLLSDEYPGDPADWEVIKLPALAEKNDVLGRELGEPLISPIIDEGPEAAVERWAEVKEAVGTYTWAAMYQQRPGPAEGSIIDTGWLRYWSRDPSRVADDGSVILLPDDAALRGGRWVDSWDLAFKDKNTSDWVVGQRWVRVGANRFLIAQQRGRWGFTESLAAIKRWVDERDSAVSPYGHLVYRRLVEDAANGPAIMETLRRDVTGLTPVTARVSKEARARAVSPEIESGHVYLPHPGDPGNGWVRDLVAELRDFPSGTHDDQVDAMTQALGRLRGAGAGRTVVPRGRIRR